jgi:Rps23 Pro-64 3,4-dihydroxylase Tpa1-like proline 4-hydroxylase
VMLQQMRTHDGWEDATVRVEADEGVYDSVSQRDVRSASILYLGFFSEVMASFDRKIRTTITPLIKNFWSIDLTEYGGTQLVRYTPGGWYETHQDAGADFEDRYFTVICYLNDNFSGGQTQFPYLSHAARPETGKAIVFPSKYFHRAEPVIEGEKYVVVSWMLGPVPIRWI